MFRFFHLISRSASFLFVFCIWRVSKSLLIMFSVAMRDDDDPKLRSILEFSFLSRHAFIPTLSNRHWVKLQEMKSKKNIAVHTFSLSSQMAVLWIFFFEYVKNTRFAWKKLHIWNYVIIIAIIHRIEQQQASSSSIDIYGVNSIPSDHHFCSLL